MNIPERMKIVGAGIFSVSILFLTLLKKDILIPYIKIDATKTVFLLIFPQLFAGFSIFRAKFISYFTYFRIYHRVFGYLIIGIYIIVSIFCIYFYIPILKGFPDVILMVHMIFGIIGYILFPLKLFWVISPKRSAYNIKTAKLGISFASILTMMFITEVLLQGNI